MSSRDKGAEQLAQESSQGGPPQHVLLDAALAAVGDAEVLGAVFTTYGIHPGFFQDDILSRLMGQESDMVRARRLLAREALGEVRPVVLYDAETVQSGNSVEGFRSDLPVHYIGIKHPTGAFHPKLSLILTGPLPGTDPREHPRDDETESVEGALVPARLIVLIASANLTPSGWRRNVEIAWTGTVERGSPCPFRLDLLGESSPNQGAERGLFDRLRAWCGEAGRETLNAMEDVVRSSTTSTAALPRIWHGQTRLDSFLERHLPEKSGPRSVELVAPFASEPKPMPVERLIRASGAEKAMVRVPKDQDDTPSVSKTWVKAVGELTGHRWGDLPEELKTTGAGTAKKLASSRYVHAKLLHLTEGRKHERAWVLSGSPNLTIRGHAGVGPQHSNVEIAVLQELAGGSQPWLKSSPTPEGIEDPIEPPEEPPERNFAGIHLVVDWQKQSLSVSADTAGVEQVEIFGAPGDTAALAMATLQGVASFALPEGQAAQVLERLHHQSVLWAHVEGFDREAVLVQEQGLLEKPDALSRELTPADILSIWATLEPFRRQKLMEEALQRTEQAGDGEAEVVGNQVDPSGALNLFERQAGQFFAFHIFKQRLRRCFKQGRTARAEVMVFGTGGDSVRSLLRRVQEQDGDAVERLVLLLCCMEVLEEVRRESPQLVTTHASVVLQVETLVSAAWTDLGVPGEQRAKLQGWVTANWPGLAP